MSYENTSCPCGGKKLPDTMLCEECESTFKDRREMTEFKDGTLPVMFRRNAAMILLSLARSRGRNKIVTSK